MFSHRGAESRFELSGEVVTGMRRLASSQHTTMFVVAMAAFQVRAKCCCCLAQCSCATTLQPAAVPADQWVTSSSVFPVQLLLSKYSTQEDVVVGTLHGTRERAELLPVMGSFANTVALRYEAVDPQLPHSSARGHGGCIRPSPLQYLVFKAIKT